MRSRAAAGLKETGHPQGVADQATGAPTEQVDCTLEGLEERAKVFFVSALAQGEDL